MIIDSTIFASGDLQLINTEQFCEWESNIINMEENDVFIHW